MKNLSLYTNADFGEKKNSLTNLGNQLNESLEPQKIYCRDFKFKDKKKAEKFEKIVPFGSLVGKISTFGFMLTKGNFKAYLVRDKVTDYFLNRIKDENSIQLFHHLMSPNYFKKARKQGKTIVTLGSNVNSKQVLKLLKKEYKKYDNDLNTLFMENVNQAHKNSDYILAYSEFVKTYLIKEGIDEKKIILVNNGVKTKEFKPNLKLKEKDFVILMVADMVIHKGAQYLIKAFDELKLENAKLWLVGNKCKEVQDLIQKTNNENIVDIPNSKPLEYYQKATIFCLPSLSEGSARVNYEAACCELPVITTFNSGSIIEDNKDGFIVPICDTKVLKEKIKFYYDNKDKVKEHGKFGRKKVTKNYDLKNFVERLNKSLKTIKKEKKIE